jgi:hypothetical protein
MLSPPSTHSVIYACLLLTSIAREILRKPTCLSGGADLASKVAQKADIVFVLDELAKKADRAEVPLNTVQESGTMLRIAAQKVDVVGDARFAGRVTFGPADTDLDAMRARLEYVDAGVVRNRERHRELTESVLPALASKSEVEERIDARIAQLEDLNSGFTKAEARSVFMERQEIAQVLLTRELADVKYAKREDADSAISRCLTRVEAARDYAMKTDLADAVLELRLEIEALRRRVALLDGLP